MSQQLANLLVKDNVVSQDRVTEVSAEAKKGQGYIRLLISKGYLSEQSLLNYLSRKFGLPTINLDRFEITNDVVNMVNVELVRRAQAVPIQSNRGTVVVVMADPTFLPELEIMKATLRQNVEAVLTTFGAFDRSLEKYYGGAANVGAAVEKFRKEQKKDGDKPQMELVEIHEIDQGTTDQDAPIINLVNGILSEAIARKASDIHVEPYETRFRVRLRVDGALSEVAQVPPDMKRAVIARFKIMSRMDIAESRVPQDGRIKLRVRGRDIDFRVNTLPTLFGEKVVLRLLDKSSLQLDLGKLGFDQKQIATFNEGIKRPNGMVLVTGPTGSGKTTTLYSALQELNKISENVSTVEDPVEYNLDGINQVQTHKEIGLTFSSVLRALLRQDPDVVLVGEIRDYETAEVGIQAALTGHLVLSTLHTNDAPSTITRLMNMGVEPFLVTSAVHLVVAQRLLRRICKKCAQPEKIPPENLVKLGFPAEAASQVNLMKGEGCRECNNTGYSGRVAIHEVMPFTDSMKEMVLKGATGIELKRQAIKEGMSTLRVSALNKAVQGITSLEEALAKTAEG